MVKKSIFPLKKNFDGEFYKLATLHRGVSKSIAKQTAKMNKAEGNKVRVIEGRGGKYAIYVKKW